MMQQLAFVVLLGVAIQFGFKTLLTLDVNKRVYNHRPGECRKIEGPVRSSEDIAFVDEKNLAFISTGLLHQMHDPNNVTWKGEIFLYDLSKRTYKAEPIPVVDLEYEDEFFPHGLSHWVMKDGTVRLFVLTHSKTFQHSIVLLDYDEKKKQLKHVRTVKDEKFVRPNDIVASGEESFFVGNDGGAQSKIGSKLEAVFGFYRGGVVYFDGKKSKYLLENTVANGIILSRDRKTLFVSHINQETIGVFSWDQKNAAIKKISEIETLTSCDNFYVDEKDHLWSACHPVIKDVLHHLENPEDQSIYSPSQVLRFKFSKDFQTAEIVEVLSDDGRFVSAGSVAGPFDSGRQMLMGTVVRGVVHCDITVSLDF